MMIFRLNERLQFPPPYLADSDGLLAFGGDLSPDRLLLAYRMGIFPWYSHDEPILWWSPDPRMVLYPPKLKISKSMRQIIKKQPFDISFDTDFDAVIAQCRQTPRPGQDGDTWIDDEMQAAYCELHRLGYAHSVEVRNAETKQLVGGLYGLALGKCYFGESMFAHQSNASKMGFIALVKYLHQQQYALIDCQVETEHLASMGAMAIPRHDFLAQIDQYLNFPTQQGKWIMPDISKLIV
ncbi:MAG: leucyl/phenylalanyl-tRNA--protein transferase [Chitinophagales bacterium]|nr:leucyl/phenylalanyl-tRNA--protein transferase [Chitinophagales bacterium]